MKIVVADDLPASALDLLRAEGWTLDSRTGRTPEGQAQNRRVAVNILVSKAVDGMDSD